MTALLQVGAINDRSQFGVLLAALGLFGEAVEVGTFRGAFAASLLRCWRGKVLTCVDPYLSGYDDLDPASSADMKDAEEQAHSILEPLAIQGNVYLQWLKMPSFNAAKQFADGSLDFAYIDARHQEESVAEDLLIWWPKIVAGGILAGHDIMEAGADLGERVQPAVLGFAAREQVTAYLVPERCAPWSYYMVRP